ncbi:uncharacterized protein LOC110251203 [Exaiptasia diaphana]|uniref:Uncharacterized protein n=1 Tax=Exaiptasia diaphana TaxID=2652724 RepID=A0A913YU83_EXADI|nr:uncharacterized protein LOC110251203 [Exaiptasia diaphana]
MENLTDNPSDLVSNIGRSISLITEEGIAETVTNLSNFMEDQVARIEQTVDQANLHCDHDIDHGTEAKRSRVSVEPEIDDIRENNDHLFELENNAESHELEIPGLQDEYSTLTEDASNVGSEGENRVEFSESLLRQHAMKLDDLYHDELNKINAESVECPSGMNETDNEDSELFDTLGNLEKMIADKDNEFESTKQNQPLYEGCPITVGISTLLIMTVAMRHGLSGEALSDILTLISLHCMSPNFFTENLYKFKQHFANVKSPLVFHHYCSHCFLYLKDKTVETCPNSLCQKSLKGVGKKSFFIEIPIVSQLQDLFKQDSIWKIITTYRFNRINLNGLGDIYDGALYRKHWESGFLRDYRNISFIYNTDGVPVFKSSKYSLWPIFLAINELPYKQRFSKDNMLLAGMWFGPDKPFMLTYLKPFHTVFHQLETSGIDIVNPSGEKISVRAILLCGTCDLPARCLVCNSIQFNGYYGCLRCLQSGKSIQTAKGGNVLVYPFNETDPSGPKRTKEGFMSDAQKAVVQKTMINGVRGPSWFAALEHHDIILGTAVDYMHCVLEGVMKLLLELWFTSKGGQGEPFNISDRVEDADKRISELKPPNRISRCPRSIEGHRKYWKANELRAFLLFYGAIVLRGILPDVYYEHFMLFSEAIFILCLGNVTHAQIDHAERLLKHFCLKFPKLYSERYQTANLHALLHLGEDVRNLGPLWTHSTFPFESLNGEILKLFHGSQNIVFQIVSAVNINRALPALSKLLVQGSDSHIFYSKLTGTSMPKNELCIAPNVFAVGKVTNKQMSYDVFQAMTSFLGAIPETTTCRVFYRLKIGNGMYHSSGYERVHSRNSYVIQYNALTMKRGKMETVQKFAAIREYLQYQAPCSGSPDCSPECVCPFHNVAIIQTLEKLNESIIEDTLTGGTASHVTITARAEKGECIAIGIHNIIQKCIYMETDDFPDKAFVCVFPNMIEKD